MGVFSRGAATVSAMGPCSLSLTASTPSSRGAAAWRAIWVAPSYLGSFEVCLWKPSRFCASSALREGRARNIREKCQGRKRKGAAIGKTEFVAEGGGFELTIRFPLGANGVPITSPTVRR
jgi:hypothetical protein